MKHTIKKLPKSQIEIEIEVSAEDLDKFIKEATEHAAQHLHVDGFRKGNAPVNIVEEKVGKESLLADAADSAVNDAYSRVIKENNLEPISQPQMQVIKLAQGNPFIFKITVSVLPEVELADYQKIASQVKKNEVVAKDEEIEESLNYIKKSRAKYSQLDRPAEKKDFVEIEYESPELGSQSVLPDKQGDKKIKDSFILGEGGFMPGFEDNIMGMKNGEEKEFKIIFPKAAQKKELAGKEVNFKVKMVSVQKVELPEINDEFAKTLGDFKDVASLMVSVKEGILAEKEAQERQRYINEIMEAIAEKSKIEVPQSLVDSERENLFNRFKHNITNNYKVPFEEYLASIKQDEKTLRESFAKEAEKKVKNYLVLREIGKKEGIVVSDEEVEKEVNNNIKNYPKDVIDKIDITQFREYTKGVIYNEKVFRKLESFAVKN